MPGGFPIRHLLVALLLAHPLAAQQFDSTASRTLAPGVVYRRMVANAGPWTVNVVAVDLRNAGVELHVLRAGDSLRGRETVSSMVRRHSTDSNRIVAAINADFFNLKTGENENNQLLDGDLWKGVPLVDSRQDHSRSVRTQFAMTAAGAPLIDRFAFAGLVIAADGLPVPLDAVNYRMDASTNVLFTPRYGSTTPRDSLDQHTFDLPLESSGRRGDTLLFRIAGDFRPGGGTAIGTGAVLATGFPQQFVRLGSKGALVRVVERFDPDRGPLTALVGGWPRLLVHGRSVADSADALENTAPSFSVTRHPRTGIGFSRDSTTLYLVTVDGRSESSSGMSLVEFANLMQSLGVYEGTNFDGGGSTTMVIEGELVNKPSDATGERTVGNALVVIVKPIRHE